jgi:hypothetical protein
MSAATTIGLETYLSKASTTHVTQVISAITKAAPAVITTTGSLAVAGDIVKITGSGWSQLDGKYFVVGGTVSATSYSLIGSDTALASGTASATTSGKVFKKADMVKMCLATVDPATEAAGTTSVGTFCDPSATVPAVAGAGTLTMTGFVETVAYYTELQLATEDSTERVLNIVLPQGLGNIIAPTILSTIGWQLPVDGAIGFTVSGALSSKPVHRY